MITIKTPNTITAKVNTAAGKVAMQVKWASKFGPTKTRAAQATQEAYAQECLRLCDKYTPLDTGTLIKSAQTNSNFKDGELVWMTPYARAQYYRNGRVGTNTGLLRGPHWGERMMADNQKHLESFARNRMAKEMN